MIKCPSCNASLPDGAGSCQFCKAVWVPNAGAQGSRRPVAGVQFSRPETWTTKAYFVVAGWWALSGIWTVLQATLMSRDGVDAFALVAGGIRALVGIGLLARIDVVRNVVTVLAFLSILYGLRGIALTFLFAPVGGIWGAVLVIQEFLDVAMSGLLIFLIGETDTHAPNY